MSIVRKSFETNGENNVHYSFTSGDVQKLQTNKNFTACLQMYN